MFFVSLFFFHFFKVQLIYSTVLLVGIQQNDCYIYLCVYFFRFFSLINYYETLSIVLLYSRWKVKVKVTQSCPTLCDSMVYTVHGILQAIILEWVAFPFSRGSSQSRDQTQVSWIAGRFVTRWAMGEAHTVGSCWLFILYK